MIPPALEHPDDAVDTGQLPEGDYLFGFVGFATALTVYDIELRNAANGATIRSQRRRFPAGNEDVLIPSKVYLETNQRLRAMLVGAIVGDVQLSVFHYGVGSP